MTDKILTIRKGILKQKPLIHCITNPISIYPCANTILSIGARPIMAEHPKEVCEITGQADALMLNLGNITDARMESMGLALQQAKEKGIPTLLDVVGVACSTLRRNYVSELFKVGIPSVIKGNYSEIMALYDANYLSVGVDAEKTLRVEMLKDVTWELALKYGTVILATGETDLITDGTRLICGKNGTPELAEVTGTGCMLGSMIATFLTEASPLDASVLSCCYFGICGELSATERGKGSFMVNLMDWISRLSEEEMLKHWKVEERK